MGFGSLHADGILLEHVQYAQSFPPMGGATLQALYTSLVQTQRSVSSWGALEQWRRWKPKADYSRRHPGYFSGGPGRIKTTTQPQWHILILTFSLPCFLTTDPCGHLTNKLYGYKSLFHLFLLSGDPSCNTVSVINGALSLRVSNIGSTLTELLLLTLYTPDNQSKFNSGNRIGP
jgi:hypothetical protein